jgi:hypothetical protein
MEDRFLRLVLADPTVAAVLDRAPSLAVGEWWLTAGLLFQTAWNGLTGRAPGTGIRDADLFYRDPDTSWDAEDAVIRRGADLFEDLPVPVEIRNQGGCTSGTPTASAPPRRPPSAPARRRSTPSPPSAARWA